MSVTISTDIFCDKCGWWEQIGVSGPRPRIAEAREKCKKLGWVSKGGYDLCPNCKET